MAGVLQHLRSSTLDKRPNPASMVDGQVAINYASGAPGMFFKDSNGDLVKVGPVHVGSSAPNVSPASGGTAGNSIGEQWLDNSGGTYVFKIWDGSAWRSEAGEFVNAAGDTMTGSLTMGVSANIIFEGSVDDGFETTLTVANPTADRTITLPNVTGTVVTTGDSGSVTSTMIANGTIVDADVNASAAIAGTKVSPNFGSQTVQTTGIFSAAGGSAAAPSIAFTGDTNTGIYSPGADQVAVATNGVGRLFVAANGNVGILGNVGIGTTSPNAPLEVLDDQTDGLTNTGLIVSSYLPRIVLNDRSGGQAYIDFRNDSGNLIVGYGPKDTYGTRTGERARIDSSGRLLVGTSSARSNVDAANTLLAPQVQIEGTDAPSSSLSIIRNSILANTYPRLYLAKTRSGAVGGNVAVISDDGLGELLFNGADGTNLVEAASIRAEVDGTPGANNMPGRLVFSTTAGGSSFPAERMRIKSSGIINFSNAPVYADNTAALAGGLVAGDVYRKSDGTLMITY
jgi:hypothetical protein